MPGAFHLEPLLMTGYAMLLVAIAGGLEWMGRHSHLRAGPGTQVQWLSD